MANPDLRLECVLRQETSNPILRLAAAFREGRQVPTCWQDANGRLSILDRRDFDRSISPDVQVICGFNKSRREINAKARKMLGVDRILVAPGETLLCLQNNRTWNVFNGQQVKVLDVVFESRREVHLDVKTDDGRLVTLPCLREQFGRDLIETSRSKNFVLMDYGYALTAHKAQGSEWDNVLVLEEVSESWDLRRWRYTVATRAKKRLIYCA